jgi:hypothetical protein
MPVRVIPSLAKLGGRNDYQLIGTKPQDQSVQYRAVGPRRLDVRLERVQQFRPGPGGERHGKQRQKGWSGWKRRLPIHRYAYADADADANGPELDGHLRQLGWHRR